MATTLESRSSTGTFPEAARPPHIDVHLERAGSLQKPEGLVGLSDDVMDVSSPRQGVNDSDSEIYLPSNSLKVYTIRLVTVTQELLLSRNALCFAFGRIEANVVLFTLMFHV